MTDEQLAQKMGISTSTLYEWKNRYPELSEALKRGKEVVDIMVENALLKRALGYSYVEVTTKESDTGNEVKRVVKEVLPDVTAQIFWLKNRRPDIWRDSNAVRTPNGNGKLDDILKAVGRIE